jgi:hypothetical protein
LILFGGNRGGADGLWWNAHYYIVLLENNLLGKGWTKSTFRKSAAKTDRALK